MKQDSMWLVDACHEKVLRVRRQSDTDTESHDPDDISIEVISQDDHVTGPLKYTSTFVCLWPDQARRLRDALTIAIKEAGK